MNDKNFIFIINTYDLKFQPSIIDTNPPAIHKMVIHMGSGTSLAILVGVLKIPEPMVLPMAIMVNAKSESPFLFIIRVEWFQIYSAFQEGRSKYRKVFVNL